MRKSQMIIRAMMAIVIMFGVETTANAQFGSLLKKAKQAVKDKVDSEEYRAKAKVRDKVEDAENNAVNKTVTKTIGSSVDVENDDYGSNDYYRKLNEEAEQEKEAKAAGRKTASKPATAKRYVSSGSSGKGGEMSFRKGGSIVGSIMGDGTVYVGGSIKGKMDGQGNIYVGGHIEGTIRNNEILKNGHVVGTVDDDGTVRLNGHIVGGIDPRTGDVRRDGSIIGKVESLSDIKKAAVFYFFGFY